MANRRATKVRTVKRPRNSRLTLIEIDQVEAKLSLFKKFLFNQLYLELPHVKVTFQDLCYKIPVPSKPQGVQSIPGYYRSLIDDGMNLCKGKAERNSQVTLTTILDELSGTIEAGTMTLVLGPPGHGKSTFLKALGNRLEESKYLTGDIYYNGKTFEEIKAAGVLDRKLVGYVGDTDLHLPLLSVRETLAFAYENAVVDPNSVEWDADKPRDKDSGKLAKLEMMLNLLGLKECENTLVGNHLIRGISGGQKRRLTIGEVLMTNARLLLLDEITTGLDAVVAYEICKALHTWATITQGTCVIALLQPTPEIFELFDEVILMRLGRIIYKGPLGHDGSKVRSYFKSQGIPIADEMDLADFLEEFLTSPSHVYLRTIANQASPRPLYEQFSFASVFQPDLKEGPENPEQDAPLSIYALKVAWQKEEKRKEPVEITGDGIRLENNYVRKQYCELYVHPYKDYLKWNAKRQLTLMSRNKPLLIPRFFQALGMGLILGSLFYQLDFMDVQSKVGLLLFSGMYMSLVNLAEVPMTVEFKKVIQKQLEYGFYPGSTYVLSVIICHMPVLIAENFFFGSIVYWLTGLAASGVYFLFYVLMLFCIGLCMSTYFRFIAYSSATLEEALTRANPSAALMLLFGGFMISYDNILIWQKPIFWISPFAWLLRSLAQNEFGYSTYNVQIRTPQGSTVRLGEALLQAMDISTDYTFKWLGPLYLVALFFLWVFLSTRYLPKRYFVSSVFYVATHEDIREEIPPSPPTHQKSLLKLPSPHSVSGSLIMDGTMEDPVEPSPLELLSTYRELLVDSLQSSSGIGTGASGTASTSITPPHSPRFGSSRSPKSITISISSSPQAHHRLVQPSEIEIGLFDGKGHMTTRSKTATFDFGENDVRNANVEKPKFSARLWTTITSSRTSLFFILLTGFGFILLGFGSNQVTCPASCQLGSCLGFSNSSISSPFGDFLYPCTCKGKCAMQSSSNQKLLLAGCLLTIASALWCFYLLLSAWYSWDYPAVESKPTNCQLDLPFDEVTLTMLDVEYEILVPNPELKKEFKGDQKKEVPKMIYRPLLRGITAYAKPRELTVVMGASGAGKTTLLDVLSGRTTGGQHRGSVLVNGAPKNQDHFRRLMGYVEQADLHIGFATVREALQFSAKLRLPVQVEEKDRNRFVEEVMTDLDLIPVANSIIGVPEAQMPGLSAGQLKRLTIGVELVANPSILFLDEPTSGLDSCEAVQVIDCVKKIAGKGRTIVCTIHQPSTEVLFKFDKLLLLQTGGHQVYFGEIGDKGSALIKYFETATHSQMPPRSNPVTWALDLLGQEFQATQAKERSELGSYYSKSTICQLNAKEARSLSSPTLSSTHVTYCNYWTQYKEVQYRHFTAHYRNVPLNAGRINALFILGVTIGLVYLQIQSNQESSVLSMISAIFMTSMLQGVTHANAGLPVRLRERAVYYRERSTNMYTSWIYSLSIGIVELPYVLFSSFMFVLPFYFLIGFTADLQRFFIYLFGTFLVSLCFVYWEQFISEAMPNLLLANALQGSCSGLLFLFGGIFIPASSIPKGWYWFYDILSWIPKGIRMLALPQFRDNYTRIYIYTNQRLVPARNYVEKYLNDEYEHVWINAMWLIVTLLILRIMVAMALRFIHHIKR